MPGYEKKDNSVFYPHSFSCVCCNWWSGAGVVGGGGGV